MARASCENLVGFLNVNKPQGMTSHDVVACLRKLFHIKRIGHAGTLDPNAQGVLLVGIGRATKFIQYLEILDKTYEAQLVLGTETDTCDITGEVIRQGEVTCSPAALKRVLTSFEGDQMQVPPIYSALKKNGKKLYEYARKGETVDIPPRAIHIDSLTCIREADFPQNLWLSVSCSKGTYIRSLCRDIGRALDVPACMGDLIRARIGQFTLDTAVSLLELEELAGESRLDKTLIPVEDALSGFPDVLVADAGLRFVENGGLLYSWNSPSDFGDFAVGDVVRLFKSGSRDFLGLGTCILQEKHQCFKPLKLL